jgi:phage baseplate assembly protein V
MRLPDALALRRLIAPLSQRIRMIVARGVVKVVNDSLKCQGLQVELLADELRDDVERFEDYGMTSHPFVDSEVLYLSVGGQRSHGIAVRVLDRRYRPKNLAEGDVCLFTDKGERVYLETSGDMLHLGAKYADDFLAKATETEASDSAIKANVDALRTAINGWTPAPADGGAALKTALTAWLASTISLSSVGTSKVKGS